MSRASIISLFLLLSIALTSCKSLEEYYNRDRKVHQRITSLELGMTKQRVMDIIQYEPDFLNKEAFSDGLREILIYRGSYSQNWMSESTPTVYRLIFENNHLVVVDADKDYEQIRIYEQRRIEQARKEAEDKRTAALIEAQKKKEEEKKSK